MSDILTKGTVVASIFQRYEVLEELGTGGQGNVYKVRGTDGDYALKWYKKSSATPQQYEAIQMLIEKGAPSDKFVWPIAICEGDSEDNFGYVMPLIDAKQFTKLSHYFSGEKKVSRFEVLIDACVRIAHGFNELHLSGLCYRDISFGNLFVDFTTGEIKICDNDNVTFDNLVDTDEIWGTSGFMAPEVVRGESAPSSQTDLFSLAVVIFRMLHLQHPLQGQREYEIEIADVEAERDLYGMHPIFIYDPIDATNRPVKGHKDIAEAYWPYYPEFIRELFTEAFTEGLHDPHKRIRESIWIKALSQLRGQVTYCYHCEHQIFYDKDMVQQKSRCPRCNHTIRVLPLRMKINNQIVMLNHDSVIYKNQLDASSLMDYETPVARIEIHPKHPSVWGLRNLSEETWTYTTPANELREISKNGVIPIRSGQEINFGEIIGIIR